MPVQPRPKRTAEVRRVESVQDTEYVVAEAGSVVQVVVDGAVRLELPVPSGKRWRGAVTMHGHMEPSP